MFKHGFPPEWSTFKKLIWLVGSGIAGASYIWKTVTGTLLHLTDALASPMQKCEVTLEPIQDLHGQDAPWPAGGGKNILDPNIPFKNGYVRGDDGTETESANTGYTNGIIPVEPETNYTISGLTAVSGSGMRVYYLGQGDEWISRTSVLSIITRTITTPTGCYGVQLQLPSLGSDLSNAMIEKGSTATSYAPYSNICPITGWTGCEVNVTGVNVWDEEWEIGSYSDTTGEKISGTRFINKNRISIKPNTSYYLKLWSGATNDMRILYYDANGSYLEITGWIYQGEFTTPADAYYMNFFLAGSYGTTYNNDISINYPSTDTDYHAYQGTTLSVTFPDSAGTVYGGTVDLVSGKLTVDKVIITDFANLYIAHNAEIGIIRSFYVRIPNNIPRKADTFVQSNLFKSQPLAGTHAYDCEVTTISDLVNRIYFSISNIDYPGMTAAQAQQFLIDNNVQFLINLATPIEIQLTPQQISTLNGVNNVWSNTNGDTTLIYKAQAE